MVGVIYKATGQLMHYIPFNQDLVNEYCWKKILLLQQVLVITTYNWCWINKTILSFSN